MCGSILTLPLFSYSILAIMPTDLNMLVPLFMSPSSLLTVLFLLLQQECLQPVQPQIKEHLPLKSYLIQLRYKHMCLIFMLHCKNGGVHSTLKLLHTTGVLLLLVCTAHSGVCDTPIVMVWSLLWCARHTTL